MARKGCVVVYDPDTGEPMGLMSSRKPLTADELRNIRDVINKPRLCPPCERDKHEDCLHGKVISPSSIPGPGIVGKCQCECRKGKDERQEDLFCQ